MPDLTPYEDDDAPGVFDDELQAERDYLHAELSDPDQHPWSGYEPN